jgi:caffeoyl-CoA O-methyltransferase
MAFIVPEEIEAYAAAHTTPAGEFLDELAAETRATLPSPQMLTGELEGRLLEFLVFLTGARRILEIGTYSGYSALSMARVLPADGTIDTLELEPKHAEFASRWIDRTEWADRITIHVGPAERALERLPGPYDLVFIEADKSGYSGYFEAALERLEPRGLIVVDNVLWSGRVLEESDDESDDTRALREFNDRVVADERVVCVMLTIRDGVTLIRRR